MGLLDIFKGRVEASSNQLSYNEQAVVRRLQEVSMFGLSTEELTPEQHKLKMESVLTIAEQYNSQNNYATARLFYALGNAYGAYTAWYIRGDDRKPYMSKAVINYEEAFRRKDSLPISTNDHTLDSISQIDIAGTLGRYLVQNTPIRDLSRAEDVLLFVRNNSVVYRPSLCSLIDLYYFKGMYEKSADIAHELVEIQKISPDWKDSPAPYPANAEAKAYRALRNAAKKENDIPSAKKWSKKLLETGCPTNNDIKVRDKL